MDKMNETPSLDFDTAGGSENTHTDSEMISVTENVARLNSTPDGASPEGRRLLLRNGYEPVILGDRKGCFIKGWTSGPVTEERLAAWEADYPQGGNTGLRTGHLKPADLKALTADQTQQLKGILLTIQSSRRGDQAAIEHQPAEVIDAEFESVESEDMSNEELEQQIPY